MSDPAKCAICDSDRRPVVDAFLRGGAAFYYIEGQMRELGAPTKAETVKRHLNRCLGGRRENALSPVDPNGLSPRSDFALAVRDEALKQLKAGTLTVKTSDGLTAQGLLDRRIEKQADRTLAMNIARLLSGAGRDVPEDIVGEVVILPTDEDNPRLVGSDA